MTEINEKTLLTEAEKIVKNQLNKLNQDFDKLKQICLKNINQNAKYANLQVLSFADKNLKGEFISPKVIEHLTKQEAIQTGVRTCINYKRADNQPILAAARAIGVIYVPPEAIEKIKEINQIKKDIKTLLTPLPRSVKNTIIKNTAPKSVLVQIYRQIAFLEEQTLAIRPSWVVSGSSSYSITTADLKKQILNILDANLSLNKDTDYIYSDLKKISQYKENHRFSIKRFSRPHVKYNIKGINGLWFSKPAHLPLFINQELEAIPYQILEELPPPPINKEQDWIIKWLGVTT